MEVNLVAEGFKFMVLGMGTVFMFLILMVFILNIQAKIINKYFPEKPEVKKAPKRKSTNDDEVVAVITAAIMKFRS